MFVIDWILAKFNYHKFYRINDIFAELDKLDKIKPARKRVAAKKPAAKKVVAYRASVVAKADELEVAIKAVTTVESLASLDLSFPAE